VYVKWYWLISFVFVNGRLERLMNTDQRILGMTDQTVTYLVKDYRNGGRYIPHTIKGIDFWYMMKNK